MTKPQCKIEGPQICLEKWHQAHGENEILAKGCPCGCFLGWVIGGCFLALLFCLHDFGKTFGQILSLK